MACESVCERPSKAQAEKRRKAELRERVLSAKRFPEDFNNLPLGIGRRTVTRSKDAKD